MHKEERNDCHLLSTTKASVFEHVSRGLGRSSFIGSTWNEVQLIRKVNRLLSYLFHFFFFIFLCGEDQFPGLPVLSNFSRVAQDEVITDSHLNAEEKRLTFIAV